MAQQTINTTDTVEQFRDKVNDNFDEVYAATNVWYASFSGTSSGTTTKYTSFGCDAALTSDFLQIVLPKAVTLSNLYIRNSSKTGVGTTTVTIMKNGSDTTITANCTSGSTTSDTTHTASFDAGDTVSIRLSVPSTDTVANVTISILAQ